MSIRLVSNEQIRFDVDVESYNRMLRDVTSALSGSLQTQIQNMISNGIAHDVAERIIENFDASNIEERLANNLNYSYIIENAKTTLIAHLLADSRFITLVNRGITSATVGVIDETVERVTTRLQETSSSEGDI
jgi:DNA-directed RNA polymerase delta subunit